MGRRQLKLALNRIEFKFFEVYSLACTCRNIFVLIRRQDFGTNAILDEAFKRR